MRRYQQRIVPGYGEGDPYSGVSYQPRTYHNEARPLTFSLAALGLQSNVSGACPWCLGFRVILIGLWRGPVMPAAGGLYPDSNESMMWTSDMI